MSSNCCKVCKSMTPCGCKDTPLTIPVNYVTDPTVCPDPNPCSEIFDSQCICYSGDDLTCAGQTWEIPSGTSAQIVIQTLFNALCDLSATVGPMLGYNIQSFGGSVSNPDLGTLTLYATDPTNETYVKSDIPFIVDRLGCADDIVVTFTWTDPDLDDIYIGTPGTNSFTIATDTSSTLIDLKLKFVAPPGGTGKTGTFTATWVSCGITKIQTYSYSIP